MRIAFVRVACTAFVLVTLLLAGCASYLDLPVHIATIQAASPMQKKIFVPSGTGAAAGAAAGGAVGHEFGGGSGKTWLTILGAGTGALFGGAMGGEEKLVPATVAQVTDDVTGQVFSVTLDGVWNVGMKLQYSITDDGKFIQR